MSYTRCMSWASRRRATYLTGIIAFFALIIGGPLFYIILSVPPTCSDGKQNQGETGVDKGGPCSLLDERYLQPSATLWARSFRVRDGSYTAVAAINNPNQSAGVAKVGYRFRLYDSQNVLVTTRAGETFIMPGSVTPVLEARIDTGNRIVAHTYFELTEEPVWSRMTSAASSLSVSDKQIGDITTAPRLVANVRNISVQDIIAPRFVAVVYDSAGNAFAASQT